MRKTFLVACTVLLAGSMVGLADEGPPVGSILDLNGQPIPSSAQQYTVDFTANLSSTAITFAFRDDPAFLFFSDASVVDLTNPGGNVLLNGDFSSGTFDSSDVADWTYANIYGATFGGELEQGCGFDGSNCWDDGAVGAYDAISQTIATNSGDQYQISFYLSEDSGDSTFMRTDPTENSGIDVLAYAQGGLPSAPNSPVPEPGTWSLMGTGLLGLALFAGRRKLAALKLAASNLG